MDLSENAKKFIEDIINKKTQEIQQQLGASQAKILELTRELAESRTEVRNLKLDFEKTRIDLDNLEQYGRRFNVRLEGIAYKEDEDEKELFKTIKKDLAEVNITITPTEVIRFHRSSKPKRNDNGVLVSQCIIRFGRWDARRRMQGVNKSARSLDKNIRCHNDLTKRRYGLLGLARDKIRVKFARSARDIFAFCDVNSNLKIRAGRDVHDFNNEHQLNAIIGAIAVPQQEENARNANEE